MGAHWDELMSPNEAGRPEANKGPKATALAARAAPKVRIPPQTICLMIIEGGEGQRGRARLARWAGSDLGRGR